MFCDDESGVRIGEFAAERGGRNGRIGVKTYELIDMLIASSNVRSQRQKTS